MPLPLVRREPTVPPRPGVRAERNSAADCDVPADDGCRSTEPDASWSLPALYDLARCLKISGRSMMERCELLDAVRDALGRRDAPR